FVSDRTLANNNQKNYMELRISSLSGASLPKCSGTADRNPVRRPAQAAVGSPPCRRRPGANLRRLFEAGRTLVKVVLRLEPRLDTTVTIAIEMPAAMRPYSMAVGCRLVPDK